MIILLCYAIVNKKPCIHLRMAAWSSGNC